jgi:lysophospholipase L1-like esterase
MQMNLAQKSIKPLALLFLSLFALLLPSQVFAAPATTIPQVNPIPPQFGWDKECDARIAAAQGQPIDLIFVGDSITQNFVEKPGAGISVWNSHYANKSLNLGVGSDGTEHILWRLEHSDIKSFTPKVVVLLAGVNDMQYSAEDIADGVRAVINKIESLYPNAKIVVMNIFPNGRDMVKTNAANQIIDTFVDNKTVFSLDLAPEMTPQGDSWKGIGGDHVHLTEEGYKIWANQLDPLLDKLSQML